MTLKEAQSITREHLNLSKNFVQGYFPADAIKVLLKASEVLEKVDRDLSISAEITNDETVKRCYKSITDLIYLALGDLE